MLESIRALLEPEAELTWMSDEHVLEQSEGEVLQPWGMNGRTGKPELRGLFCARIFGAMDDFRCLCGKYEGQEHWNTTCEKCGVTVAPAEMRRANFGHIELARPMHHPWSGRQVVRLPVLPAGHRELDPDRSSAKLTGINALYEELIRRNQQLSRCVSKSAPGLILDHETKLLQEAVDGLFGRFPERPGQGEKLGPRARRQIANEASVFSAPLQASLGAAGILWAYGSSVEGPPFAL